METCRVDRRRLLTGIDVNKSPKGDVEDKLGLSSPNSTLLSLSWNKRSLIREVANGEDVMERSRSEDQEDGDYCRKKLRLSKEQAVILEESFKEHNTLNHVSCNYFPLYLEHSIWLHLRCEKFIIHFIVEITGFLTRRESDITLTIIWVSHHHSIHQLVIFFCLQRIYENLATLWKHKNTNY